MNINLIKIVWTGHQIWQVWSERQIDDLNSWTPDVYHISFSCTFIREFKVIEWAINPYIYITFLGGHNDYTS